MKHTKLIAIFFATYHIASFSSQHQSAPALQTIMNKIVMIQRENAENNHQRIVEYYNQFPKVSQEEINRWVAKKEREIKENQAQYKKEQEQQEIRWLLKYNRKNRHQRSPYHKAIKKDLQNDHRNRYNPHIKTIECYPTRLLLELKK